MSDWYEARTVAAPYREHEAPEVFLQWKGTDVCFDFTCDCGESGHFDGYFADQFRCRCGQVYAMPITIFPVKIGGEAVHSPRELEHDEDE